MNKFKLVTLAAIIPSVVLLSGCSDSPTDDVIDTNTTKNIILMISDGASDGAWDISSYWTHGEKLNNIEPYNRFTHQYAMTTFPLNTRLLPQDCESEAIVTGEYDPTQAWSDEATGNESRPFAGYEYINKGYTDSAAAGTALATGQKTYNSGISVDYCGRPMKLITEYAKEQGLATGVVTSVEFSHATPSVFGAHHTSRFMMKNIGSQMLNLGHLDLIMSAGHPMFDDDGVVRDSFSSGYINEEDFNALTAGELTPEGSEKPWGFIDHLDDFKALAKDTIDYEYIDAPLFGFAPVASTMQQKRSCGEGENPNIPFDCAPVTTVPSLELMTKGALNYLSKNEGGFFLMVEGGAVDWAAHGNDTARIIEEQIDFNDSVQIVMDWVDQYSSWDETVLIVTTDHGNSYVLGVDSDQVAYSEVQNPGREEVPEVKYYSVVHTNELVRVYAKGFAAENFKQHFDGIDENYAHFYNHEGATGEYFDNTNIFDVMKEAITQ